MEVGFVENVVDSSELFFLEDLEDGFVGSDVEDFFERDEVAGVFLDGFVAIVLKGEIGLEFYHVVAEGFDVDEVWTEMKIGYVLFGEVFVGHLHLAFVVAAYDVVPLREQVFGIL